MRLGATPLPGCMTVDIEPHRDSRGFFARIWCAEEFAAAGLPDVLAQCSLSRNTRRGTVRGLHLQRPPGQEGKLVRCVRGAIHDVALDLRHDSPTFLQHFAIELSDENYRALYIPPGCAHGFQTLVDETEVLYQITAPYAPALSSGVRWNDPTFGIRWPLSEVIILDRDRDYPDFDRAAYASLSWT